MRFCINGSSAYVISMLACMNSESKVERIPLHPCSIPVA